VVKIANLLGDGFHNLIMIYGWFMVSPLQLILGHTNVHDSKDIGISTSGEGRV
jgi:hypothetical protein